MQVENIKLHNIFSHKIYCRNFVNKITLHTHTLKLPHTCMQAHTHIIKIDEN